MKRLEEVFKISGIPTYTFVRPAPSLFACTQPQPRLQPRRRATKHSPTSPERVRRLRPPHMAKGVEATPTATVLEWARKNAGISVDVAAKRAGVKPERLEAWERGEANPTISQLRALAAAYRRPLALFYLSEPPYTF